MRFIRLVFVFLAASAALLAEDIPDGYRYQVLEPLGGKVLMPKDWHFENGATENSFFYIFSKEKMDGNSYETGFRIQVVLKVSETGVDSSETIAANILLTKEHAKQILNECDEEGVGPFQKRCLETIESNPRKPEDDFHVIYAFYWSNEADILWVSIFGAPESSWPEAKKIYDKISAFRLFGNNKAEE